STCRMHRRWPTTKLFCRGTARQRCHGNLLPHHVIGGVHGSHSLVGPVFDIEYHARESSRGVSPSSAPDVNYALIISVQVDEIPDIYNLIRQKYQILQPVEVTLETAITT
ncbi:MULTISPECIES: hypothetical protein, partial [Pseudomonas]|uniref:hypothetical protein n=1 Tax=Pseudomonas TaxID=286 RepID=UPI00211B0854